LLSIELVELKLEFLRVDRTFPCGLVILNVEFFEICMGQSFTDRDPLLGIKHQKFLQQVNCIWRCFWENLVKILAEPGFAF